VIVTRLSLADFRNYRNADVEFVAGPNLLVGSNGQGKTNLVEAIYYLAALGSHRVSSDQALVRSGADRAIVRARLEHADRSVLVEVEINRTGANRAQVNRVATKPRELPRSVAAVLFAPEDLSLVRGEPGGRRRFLDQLLVQLQPRFAGVLADFERVLKQRNTLLKSARGVRNPQLGTLDLWDERLVDLGAQLIDGRAQLIERLRPHLAAGYQAIAGAEHALDATAALSILGSQPDEDESDAVPAAAAGDTAEAYRLALARVRSQELDRGLTLVGPHRDDLVLVLNGLTARHHASHGESWSVALALKLAAAAALREESRIGDPVLILDDVFAELDVSRRARLAGAIAGYEQVLITAAVLEDVPEELRQSIHHVVAGTVDPGERVE
jgi:DNA replication and repair protein RecF